MRVTTNPLSINFGFLGNHQEIIPGSSPELYISINNRGSKNAVIDIFIDARDENSLELNQWINPKRVRLEINSEQEKNITFQIQVPDNAWPNTYHYDVVFDSPDHYPEYTPLSYPQILKILPSPATLTHGGEDPSFFLSPVTSSTNPIKIKSGETFEVDVFVENRTALVDRFYIVCPDLKPEYFSASYPEVRDQYGLVIESDGLELNPGKSGTVKFKLHPPHSAPAGNYYPTIRLASVNNPRLNLLDVVYLHIPPAYEIELEIKAIKDKIKDPKTESGEYQLKILNQGNLERNLIIKSHNKGWGSLTFSIDPDFKTLTPGALSQVQMLVKPKGRWWNRPFYGVGREFKFGVEVEDMNNLSLPYELPESKLTWEPYPKKWFIFLIVLLSVIAAGGAIAIAFAVWNTFFKQPPQPKIIELSPSKSLFKESSNEAIQLNWKIQNAKNIGKLTLNQQGTNGNEMKTFEFKRGIPIELNLRNPKQTENYCDFQRVMNETNLICRGIMTSALKPGQYQFELQVFNQKDLMKPVSILKTDTVQLLSAGLPKITELFSPRPEYFINAAQKSPSPVLLNWGISNSTQISQIKLVGLAKDGTVATALQQFEFQNGKIPKKLEPFCKLKNGLSCQNVPILVRKPGLYTFRIAVTPKKGGDEVSLTKVTDFIQVKPILTVKIPSVLKRPKSDVNSQQRVQGKSNFKDDKSNAFIPPSSWPSNSSRNLNTAPFRSYPSSQQRLSPQPNNSPLVRQQSIQQANDIVKGLLVANEVGVIPTRSQTWYKVQDSIKFLRNGNSLEIASQRSGVSLNILSSLVVWGQRKNLPQKPSPQVKSSQSIAPEPGKSPMPKEFTKPPQPLWSNSTPSMEPAAKNGQSSSEPLW